MIIMDYHGLSWIIVDHRDYHDYNGLWTIPRPLKAKAETTAQRYGAGMAHPTTSPWSWMIMDYHGLWTIMDYRGLSWITLDYHGLSKIMDYPGLAWSILDYRGLPWIIKD